MHSIIVLVHHASALLHACMHAQGRCASAGHGLRQILGSMHILSGQGILFKEARWHLYDVSCLISVVEMSQSLATQMGAAMTHEVTHVTAEIIMLLEHLQPVLLSKPCPVQQPIKLKAQLNLPVQSTPYISPKPKPQ